MKAIKGNGGKLLIDGILRTHSASDALRACTREQLRELARANNVPRGRNTDDTIRNLLTSGKLQATIIL